VKSNPDSNRFRDGAGSYAAYLETPEGRLRSDLAFANLRGFLPLGPRRLRVLDIGSGAGTMALRLARLGFQVTLLDSSPQMLDLASTAARGAGLGASIAPREGDAYDAASLFQGEFFDLILCHNLLEFMDDPGAVLRAASQLMLDASLLSVLVRTQAGEVFKAAIQAGDLEAATDSLSAAWGRESLCGGRVRLFQPEDLIKMLRQISLTTVALRGVRVISDYLPPTICREAEYDRILALERRLGRRPEFARVARYAQLFVRRTTPKPGRHS
jgi:S-adenosylmethionine-dependent methyltransferase